MEAQETSSLWFFTVEETEKNPCAIDGNFLNVNKSIDNLNVEQNVWIECWSDDCFMRFYKTVRQPQLTLHLYKLRRGLSSLNNRLEN